MIQRSNGQASFFVQERTSDLVRRLQGGKPLTSISDLPKPASRDWASRLANLTDGGTISSECTFEPAGDLPEFPPVQAAVELHVGGEVYKGRVTGIETDPNKELSVTCEFPEKTY